MSCIIEAACAASTGRVRTNNEDNFFFNGIFLPQQNNAQTSPLLCHGPGEDQHFAVFDGMGGGDYGEAAAYAAALGLAGILRGAPAAADPQAHWESISKELNHQVFQKAESMQTRRMGCTLAGISIHGGYIYACNVGDSRIYGLRGDKLLQISADHSDELYMRKNGITDRKPRLTQYLGMDESTVQIEPYIAKAKVKAGDVYLICSDGLTDMLGPEEIKRILAEGQDAGSCASRLVAQALAAGGKDNVTVIICRIQECFEIGREQDDTDVCDSTLEGMEDHEAAGLGKLWIGLRDRAAGAWRKYRAGRDEGDIGSDRRKRDR